MTDSDAGRIRGRVPLLAAIARCALLMLMATTTAQAASASVSIRGFAFQPPVVTVNVGDSLTWTNSDPVTHTATANSGAWDTGFLDQGQSKTLVMTVAGTFAYHCAVHPSMTGTVNVLGAATPAPTPPPAATPPPTLPPSQPSAPPTAAPSAPPAPAAASPGATGAPALVPSPTAAPTSSATPSPTLAASLTPAPATTASQASPSPVPTSPPAPGSDGGQPPLLILGAIGLIAVAGAAFVLRRRS